METLQTLLQKRLVEISQLFFPRWRDAKEWHVVVQQSEDYEAQCHAETKTIRITDEEGGEFVPDEDFPDIAVFDATLVHEICHAVAGPWHAKKFLNRLAKARDRATDLKMDRLAHYLDLDIKALRENFDRWAAHDQVIKTMAEQLGVSITTMRRWIKDIKISKYDAEEYRCELITALLVKYNNYLSRLRSEERLQRIESLSSAVAGVPHGSMLTL